MRHVQAGTGLQQHENVFALRFPVGGRTATEPPDVRASPLARPQPSAGSVSPLPKIPLSLSLSADVVRRVRGRVWI